MSHRFKQPAHISPSVRRDARSIRIMATHIGDQAMLDRLLFAAAPDMRVALLDRLTPYLPFTPEVATVTADCPHCGFRRGTAIAHECNP